MGSNWWEDPEGRKCKEIGDTFEKILDVNRVVTEWNNDVNTYKK